MILPVIAVTFAFMSRFPAEKSYSGFRNGRLGLSLFFRKVIDVHGPARRASYKIGMASSNVIR